MGLVNAEVAGIRASSPTRAVTSLEKILAIVALRYRGDLQCIALIAYIDVLFISCLESQ